MTAMGNIQARSGRDRRYWPRMNGGVTVAYRVIAEELWAEEKTAWLDAVGPAPADFHRPDPFMEVSVGGLRFDDVDSAKEGDLVIAALRVPTAPTDFHVTARVVRVDPIPDREREEAVDGEPERTHRIAIEFLQGPARLTDALCEYTERLQELQISINVERPLQPVR